jgi:hypothetical protein
MNMVEFLETLREPVRLMTGLPDGAVTIYAQQDLAEQVAHACAVHQCAVLIGLTGARGNPDRQVPNRTITAVLEVEVWTPKVILTTGGVQCLTICESIMAGLHGYAVSGRLVTTGSARVPAFTAWTLREERSREGAEYLVGNLQFTVPLVPVPLVA